MVNRYPSVARKCSPERRLIAWCVIASTKAAHASFTKATQAISRVITQIHIFQARLTRVPLIGTLVRRVANCYGKKMSGAHPLTIEEANEVVDTSDGLAVDPCTCRAVSGKCDKPVGTEIMVGLNRNMFMEERPHDYHEITKQEAKEILKQCHEVGLIHTIVKCRRDFYAICNCCSCCCLPLRLSKEYGIGGALTRRLGVVEELKRERRSGA